MNTLYSVLEKWRLAENVEKIMNLGYSLLEEAEAIPDDKDYNIGKMINTYNKVVFTSFCF